MTQTIQNGISNLENLFAVNAFLIPQYQRAFSWEEPQLEAFLEDLRQQVSIQRKAPDKHYFLGTFLLHEETIRNRQVVNVVDGQQRMTTAVVFIAKALALHAAGKISLASEKPALLRRTFVRDDVADVQRFHTILEDEPFFQSEVLRVSAAICQQDSPSSRRLMTAAKYFENMVMPDEWGALISTLKTAKVMIYAVTSAEDATQIFELQNDRGKSLTSLEALKSYLMHCVYLHSPSNADDRLAALQTLFSKVYRTVEALAELKRTPNEDQVLAYHSAAFLSWTDKEDYNNPKQLVKATIKSMNGTGVIGWIEEFVSSLVESYRSIDDMFARRDELSEFSELLVLGRMASFWPLVLKTWRHDKTANKTDFRKTCRLLEVFTFRGYAVANLRTDTSLSQYHIAARDFSGNFQALFMQLSAMCHWHNLDNRFVAGLDNAYFYFEEEKDAHYLLWRYENDLRKRTGQQQPLLSWRDFVEPRNYAAKFSVEHVASQDHPLSQTIISWDENDPKPFKEVALHRLGNLVIDSISPNASKKNGEFADKLESLSVDSIYLSQGELIRFVKDRKIPVWDLESVRARHMHMLDYAKKTWDPSTWHTA